MGCVIGAETPEQVRENIRLMDGPSISEKTEYEISNLFDNIPVHVLNPGLWKK
jgi:aryl-alcohol dehydrogenase-like predicted oxidoreductase